MNLKSINSVMLITLSLLGTTLMLAGYIPNIPPLVPEVRAAPPNNPATLGLFSESKRSNAVVDTTIGSGGTFTIDVNVTDGVS